VPPLGARGRPTAVSTGRRRRCVLNGPGSLVMPAGTAAHTRPRGNALAPWSLPGWRRVPAAASRSGPGLSSTSTMTTAAAATSVSAIRGATGKRGRRSGMDPGPAPVPLRIGRRWFRPRTPTRGCDRRPGCAGRGSGEAERRPRAGERGAHPVGWLGGLLELRGLDLAPPSPARGHQPRRLKMLPCPLSFGLPATGPPGAP
jgi:hypothetical protein